MMNQKIESNCWSSEKFHVWREKLQINSLIHFHIYDIIIFVPSEIQPCLHDTQVDSGEIYWSSHMVVGVCCRVKNERTFA